MAEPAFQDFHDLAALWSAVARRSRGTGAAEAQIFNQMAVALAARLPDGPGEALVELHRLARAIQTDRVLSQAAPISGHQAFDRVALTAQSFQTLARACHMAL